MAERASPTKDSQTNSIRYCRNHSAVSDSYRYHSKRSDGPSKNVGGIEAPDEAYREDAYYNRAA
jgi:hypothetical protein